jgi:hypothetical protein
MTPILRAVAKGLASRSAINQASAVAKQAEAERAKRAKIIHADGECQAAAKLAETAGVMNKEPAVSLPVCFCALLHLNKWYRTRTNVLRQYTIPLLKRSQLKHQGIVRNR